MSAVSVDFTGDATSRAEKMLAGIPGGVEKAVRSAMSRGVSHLRAQSIKTIQERYAISAEHIRANENITVRYSYQDGVQVFVLFHGHKIPLYRYNGTSPGHPGQDTGRWIRTVIAGAWRTVHPSSPVYGHQLKRTTPAHLPNAFVARMDSGHTGIFQRTGGTAASGRSEIEEVMGLAVPQMLGGEETAGKLTQAAMAKFEERLDHENLRILNGWGGKA